MRTGLSLIVVTAWLTISQLISAIREVTASFDHGTCLIFFIASLPEIISVLFNVAGLIKVSRVLNSALVFPIMYETSYEASKIGFSFQVA